MEQFATIPGRMARSAGIAMFLLFAANTQGQSWEVFDTTSAGFPSNSVTDIAIDSQDNVWVATNWGLCKYDGTSWQIFQTSNSGLTDNVVQCVAVDTLDRVWIGTLLHGIVVYDGSTRTTYDTQNSGLPDDQIKCITIDHRNWAWVGTYLGVACYTGSEWRLYDNTPESYNGLVLNGPVIQDVAVREDGLVAIGTLNGGFHYLTDTCVQVHGTFIDFFPDNTQVGVAFDPLDNERWIAVPAHGLIRHFDEWNSGLWFEYSTATSNIPTNSSTCLAMDPLGRPWVGSTYAGISFRDTDGSFTNYMSTNSGLPDNTISSLAFAHDGSLWVGTFYGGAARFDQTALLTEQNGEEDIEVYPNPTTDVVKVRWPSTSGVVMWQLFDQTGRRLGGGVLPTADRSVIDLRGFLPGVYNLRLLSSRSSRLARIIVE
ncbi:MAG: two-component regulator propeller domain-containing protein [Flavobacteriales bacterium]